MYGRPISMTADEKAYINRILDMQILDHMARESGEKPADEWQRKDFHCLFRCSPQLKNLTTLELRALFLTPTETINGVLYCQRWDVRSARRRRSNGEKPFYALAFTAADLYALNKGYMDTAERVKAEEKKLNMVWVNL